MSLILSETRGEVRILSLNNPKANPLNEPLVAALQAEFDRAQTDDAVRAVVLTSAVAGYFSVGLDVREVFDYPRDRMARFWVAFVELYEGVYNFPKPVVAGLTGHTFAGGIILALACHVRVMARGDHGLGVSGINLGLVLPIGVMNMAINAVGQGHARRLFQTGETISPETALTMGLVHDLTNPGDVVARAVERAADLGRKSPAVFRAIHHMFDELSGRSELPSDKDNLDRFLDIWFSPAAIATREAVRNQIAGAR